MSNIITKVLGIDPGQKGATGFISPALNEALKLPLKQVKTKKVIDGEQLASRIRTYDPEVIVLEDVYSSSQMGVVGAFTFGENKGTLRGICYALGYTEEKGNLLWVHPAVWKPAMNLSSDKMLSKDLATQLFPNVRIGSIDAAEAMLIATNGSTMSFHNERATSEPSPTRSCRRLSALDVAQEGPGWPRTGGNGWTVSTTEKSRKGLPRAWLAI
jgi:hypothetical protein